MIKKEIIIQSHKSREYLDARNGLKKGMYNGAFFYSEEIVNYFIPKIDTDYNWQTINHQVAPDKCIVFVHSNNALYRYDYLLTYEDIILVCSTRHSVERLLKKGHKQVIYVPISIDCEYLDKFKQEEKEGHIACGNIWAFTGETKEFFKRKGIIHYHDIERHELLSLMGKSETVYAIGRTAMEAIYLGANVIQPDKEYPVEKYDTFYTQDEAIHIMQRELNILKSKRMKKVVGIATMVGREQALNKAILSLVSQVDDIIIYDNRITSERHLDKADNGKFYGLTKVDEPCYYFTCDDDILYPDDYIESMIDAIESTGSIVTHHGRVLTGKDRSYYRGHKTISFKEENDSINLIDVCGTGVTGFRTDYFNPIELHNSELLRMSDLLFSLEAKKQGKKIVSLPHKKNWLKQINVDLKTSIAVRESNNESEQIKLANKIWELKNLK